MEMKMAAQPKGISPRNKRHGLWPACATVFLFLLQAILSASLQAGEISLFVQNTTSVTQDCADAAEQAKAPVALPLTVSSEIRITNQGNETAKDVWLTASLLGQKKTTAPPWNIEPQKSKVTTLDFTLAAEKKGTFPIRMHIRYKDPAGQSFGTVALALARTPAAPFSDLSARISWNKRASRIDYRLHTPNPALADATITCLVPEDLMVDVGVKPIKFKNSAAAAEFEIRNRAGLRGSRYVVFLIAEYEVHGIHYVSSRNMIIAVDELKGAREPLWLWIYLMPAIFGLLVTGAVVLHPRLR